MLISVLGTGYLGATHAACLARWGHRVVGVDTDPERVQRLCTGHAPFHEPGLDDALRTGLAQGRLRFTTDLREVAGADVHFLCVGTPQRADGDAADLTALWAAVHALAPLLERPCVVAGKSTVPVGTAARARGVLQEEAPAGPAVETAWNPEFLREGHALEDSLHPDRLVVGTACDDAFRLLRDGVYARPVADGVPVVRTDLATAELAKVSANVMLAARVSLVNVLAEVCEAAEADVADLTRVLGLDPRIGDRFLTPGLGYGGGCLPKDTRAFVARAEELGLGSATRLLREVDATNERQRCRTVELAVRMLGGDPAGACVGVLGAAFKAGSDDVRDSPALDVASRLAARGADVSVYDPRAGANVRRERPQLRVGDTAEDAVRGSDVVLVLTDWPEFGSLDPGRLAKVARVPRVVDGRLALDPVTWRAAGWDFHALGRGAGS